MTYKDIDKMIKTLKLPYAYDMFPNNVAPEPPYLVFNYPNRDDFGADDINYVGIEVLNLELYTSQKSFKLEKKVEAMLTQYGFFYEKTEAYIRTEHLYQITYVSQFVLGEENG